MKLQVSPAVVGAFVLGAFTLAILALLFFGGVSFFHQQQRFVVYFDESIQGLNLGSPVKLRGVGVGRVVSLNVRYDTQSNDSVVAVVCELDRNMVVNDKGVTINVSSRTELQALVDHGLRAQLGVVGLATGLLYVELDFFDPKVVPPRIRYADSRYLVVPAVPSTISEFQASATDILTRIKRIDFEGIAADFKGLLTDARRQVNSIDLKGLGDQLSRAGASVETLANSPQFKATFDNLNRTMDALQSTLGDVHASLAHVDTQVDVNGRQLQAALVRLDESLKEFTATVVTIRRFVGAQQNLGSDADRALVQMGEAAEAVQRLADFIERNPNALISGRKSP